MKSIIALLLGAKSVFGAGWDYDHMSEWSHHYSMCGLPDQSPINIETESVIYDSSVCQSQFNWTIDWTVHNFRFINNGHTIVLKPVEKTTIDPDGDIDEVIIADDGTAYTGLSLNENAIARLPNYFTPDGSPHTEFCLDSMHFHWGLEDDEGSEHTVDAVQYPMEVHFVHYSCEHASLGTTLGPFSTLEEVQEGLDNGDDVHQLGVVGIFFELTDYDNPLFDAILNEDILDRHQFSGGVEEVITNIYLQDIIPEEVFTDGYYSYQGSLTTPPCTNIVRWHVMNAKSYIGKAQIARFRELMYTQNKTMAPNYREIMPKHHNVYACFEEYIAPDIITQAEKTTRVIMWVYAVFVFGLMFGMGFVCIRRSKKDAQLLSEEDTKQKRDRLASRSSIGGAHDMSRQMSRQSSHAGSQRGSVAGSHH